MDGIFRTVMYFINPYTIVLLILCVGVTLAIYFWKRKHTRRVRAVVFSLACMFTFGIVFMTLLRDLVYVIISFDDFRNSIGNGIWPDWMGWWRWQTSRFIDTGVFTTEITCNVLLFMPATFLWGIYFKRPYLICLGAVTFSVLIECLQGFTMLGVADLMDFVSNSFGAWLGTMAAVWVLVLVHSQKASKIKAVLYAISATVISFIIILGSSVIAESQIRNNMNQILIQKYANTKAVDFQTIDDRDWSFGFSNSLGNRIDNQDNDTDIKIGYPVDFYFVHNCLIAHWTESGFETYTRPAEACKIVN